MSDDETPMRERILEAAERCFGRFGVGKTTIEDIAAEAGVSRATVYRYVTGGREEIVLSVLIAEAGRQMRPMVERVQELEGFAKQMSAMMVEIVVMNRGDDRVRTLFSAESLGIGTALPGVTELLLARVLEVIDPLLHEARRNGELRSDLTDAEVAEWLLRIMMSLLTFEADRERSPEEIRRFLDTFVMPPLAPTAT